MRHILPREMTFLAWPLHHEANGVLSALPLRDVSVVRDFVVTDFSVKKNTGILSVMKYRPVAMCAAFDGPPLTLPDFTKYAVLDPCASVPIDMSIREVVSPLWPEHASHVDPLQAAMVGTAYMESGVETTRY